ncbi:hypothetical protein [Novosphingobium sp.]|uniref:hypothetical protein n=1 Tax=Novosphingobium sp. TaxID=1874826 RepID=UPI003BA86D5D
MTPRGSMVEHGSRVSRGQPVIALALILAVWISIRMTFIALEGVPAADKPQLARLATPSRPPTLAPQPGAPAGPGRHNAGLAALAVPNMPRRTGAAGGRRYLHTSAADFGRPVENPHAGLLPRSGADMAAVELAAAYRVPETGGENFGGPRVAYASAPHREAEQTRRAQGQPRKRRWSADGWLLVRAGDQPPALAAGAAAYGGSQAGAVLRYAFAPVSALRPQAYLRVSGALGNRVRQNEAALGLMVRPLRRLPVAVLGEWRLQAQSGQTRTRPVVMAVTELPPLRLPLGIEAEAYVQGGWAGGRGATPFYDLSASFQRRVMHPLPGAQLSAGGGVWSGGQRGAARLDLGPRIELRTMVGPPSRRIGVRVGVDWRFRVAGRAEPGSGPALTVAAGF